MASQPHRDGPALLRTVQRKAVGTQGRVLWCGWRALPFRSWGRNARGLDDALNGCAGYGRAPTRMLPLAVATAHLTRSQRTCTTQEAPPPASRQPPPPVFFPKCRARATSPFLASIPSHHVAAITTSPPPLPCGQCQRLCASHRMQQQFCARRQKKLGILPQVRNWVSLPLATRWPSSHFHSPPSSLSSRPYALDDGATPLPSDRRRGHGQPQMMVFDFIRKRAEEGIQQVQNIATKTAVRTMCLHRPLSHRPIHPSTHRPLHRQTNNRKASSPRPWKTRRRT